LENFVPVFFAVRINDIDFIAEGGGYSANFQGRLSGGGEFMTPYSAPFEYPAPGVLVTNFSATILPSLSTSAVEQLGLPGEFAGYGGSMSINYVYDMEDPDELDDQFMEDGMGIIRLYRPVDE
jgi:hypothetical protein